jgi:predicted Rossmann fold flavoprotein
MLLDECRAAHVEVRTGHRVTDIARTDRFRIETNRTMLTASALVVATGGLSIPKMGATGFAYDVARRFGLAIVEPRPGLVGLQMGDDLRGLCNALTGVSVDAIATCGRTSFRESLLFTHRGFSGPAILQISSYWKNGGPILLDLAPAINAENFLRDRKRIRPKAELKTVLAEVLPHRLAEAIAKETNATDPEMANLPDRLLGAIARRLQRWEVRPVDSEGWSKAEVTVGGIDTAGLSSRTMEARAVAGLYFIGEAVDVTGWLGGYNFQWGWSSGWCAGQAI